MKTDSLKELKAAFDKWRRKKRHVREPVPDELWERACRAIGPHGLEGVVRATRLERSRLVGKLESKKTRRTAVPSFSQLALSAPSTPTAPIAEIETAAGVKLRIFAQTQETLSLLSSLCGTGGTP
jgi:hypothetical protein